MSNQMKSLVQTGLIERDEEENIMSLALLTGEHVLLIGDPGVGKSLLASEFCRRLDGVKHFETGVTKQSTEEVFLGPLSIKGYREGKYAWEYEDSLLTANTAFIDEVFDASDALLRTLLRILNEREFKRGTFHVKCPLETCIAAANYTRVNEVTAAVIDRFLFKWAVSPVRAKERLISWTPLQNGKHVSLKEVGKMREDIAQVTLSNDMAKALVEIARSLKFSDRTLNKSAKVVRAAAFMAGRDKVKGSDLDTLVYFHSMNEQDRAAAQNAIRKVTEEFTRREKMTEQIEFIETLEKEIASVTPDEDGLRALTTIIQDLEKLSPMDATEVPRRKNAAIEKAKKRHEALMAESGLA